jgi:FkbM family methyltransferase
MVMNNPVIVTALYDIGRHEWDNYKLSYEVYLNWMKNTLSLNSKMVIFTEWKFYQTIADFRKVYDPNLKNTIIVVSPLEQLDSYKKYQEALVDVMESESFKKKIHHNVPEMTRPLYNIIMFNKLNFLQIVKDNKYFNADFLIWADAGGLRDDISTYEYKTWPSIEKLQELPENKIIFFSHVSTFDVDDKEFHALSQIRRIQGTAFFVPTYMIDDLVKDFNDTIHEMLSSGYIGSDEKVFDITYCKNKERYHLIECTWRMYFDLFKTEDINSDSKNIFLDLGTHECQGLNHFINYELNIDNSWEIHTFEPNPLINTDSCVDNFKNLNITLHRKAVWVKDDKITFKQYGPGGTSQGSLLEETGGGKLYGDYYNQVQVECIDIYKFIKSLDETSNIYIKMDVEWSEYEIINHMLQLGWPTNIRKIWVEWHNTHDGEYKKKSELLKNKIEEHNTKVINWY